MTKLARDFKESPVYVPLTVSGGLAAAHSGMAEGVVRAKELQEKRQNPNVQWGIQKKVNLFSKLGEDARELANVIRERRRWRDWTPQQKGLAPAVPVVGAAAGFSVANLAMGVKEQLRGQGRLGKLATLADIRS